MTGRITMPINEFSQRHVDNLSHSTQLRRTDPTPTSLFPRPCSSQARLLHHLTATSSDSSSRKEYSSLGEPGRRCPGEPNHSLRLLFCCVSPSQGLRPKRPLYNTNPYVYTTGSIFQELFYF
ncbi:hypothetical protein B0H12DRAFT_1086605 [Mycena haematopus]|nr:hypothetical protein B0H12DRAFT_1086605 [Mycena haematopus]